MYTNVDNRNDHHIGKKMGISADETNFFHGMTMMTMLIEGRNLSSSTRKNSFKLKPVTLNRKSLSKTEEKNAEGKCSGASWWWKQIMGQPFLFHGAPTLLMETNTDFSTFSREGVKMVK